MRGCPRTGVASVLAGLVLVAIGLAGATPPAAGADPYEGAPPYLKPLTARASVEPLVTVGQVLPQIEGPEGAWYRFVGRPDGLAVFALVATDSAPVRTYGPWKDTPGKPRLVVLVNHELHSGEGGPVGPLPRGARVSEILLDWRRPRYIPPPLGRYRLYAAAGRCAIERVFTGDEPLRVEPVTRGFSKFCSGFLADSLAGFDPPIYLLGEEDRAPATFDPRGGLAWAIVDGSAYALPRLGRAEWENIVVAPFTHASTVLFGLEDASEADAVSQLYMYVGTKQPDADDPLTRNGLHGGRLYVLCGDDPRRNSEAAWSVRGDTLAMHWAPLEWDVTDAELDAASRAAGAFEFVRLEDGDPDPRRPGFLYFVTTGRTASDNPRGRLYRLQFDPDAPAEGARLTILLDGSEGVVHPDNIDVNRHGQIAIQEDPGGRLSDPDFDRDASIWIYEIEDGAVSRIATMDRDAAGRHARSADKHNAIDRDTDTPGSWESSGIVDVSAILGRGAWLCTVQAPSLRIAPVDETVEGGQVLLLRYR